MNFSSKRRSKFFLLILTFFLTFYNYTRAGLEGPELIISNKEYDQQNPSVIYLPDKNIWFVVWEDNRNQNLTGSDIYGVFVKNDGSICGTEFVISNSSGNQTHPAVTYNLNSNWIVVVWQDTRGNNAGGYIYYNYVDISGLDLTNCTGYAIGTEVSLEFNAIDGDSLVSRQKPKVEYDPINNKYYIVYLESRNKQNVLPVYCFERRSETYFRHYVGDTSFIGIAELDDALNPIKVDIIRNTIISNDSKSRLISYASSSLEEVYRYEYFTQVDNPVIEVDTTANQQIIVFEGVRHIGEVICRCEDKNGDNKCNIDDGDVVSSAYRVPPDNEWPQPTDKLKHIFGLWLSDIPLGSIYHLYIDSGIDTASYYPDVAFDSVSKRFLIVWESSETTGNSKIYGQLISSGSGHYGNNFIISFQDLDNDGIIDPELKNSKQTNPFVEFDPVNQRYLVIWQDGRNGTVSLENLDIYGQYVDLEGSLRGNNYVVSTAPNNQLNPVVSFNEIEQQYIAVWKDARNANKSDCDGDKPCGSDIYGQRFTIGQPQITLFKENGELLSPAQIDFGISQHPVEKLIYIKNTGDAILELDCIREKDGNLIPEIFRVELVPEELLQCDGVSFSLLPGTSIPLKIIFSPEASARYSTTIAIENNASEISIYLQGLGSVQAGSPSNNVSYTENTNPPPSIGGGGGGCSVSKSSPDYLLLLGIIILLIGMRVLKMRKTFTALFVISLSSLFVSCGTGPGSDTGGSVFVNALNVDPNYISADVIDAYDDNSDNVCDRFVIPADDIVVNITFKSEAVSDTVKASDVNFYKYVVEYFPVRSDSPRLEAKSYVTTCTVKPDTETTCTFTVASHNLKQFIVENNLYGADYNVKITAFGNEVLYDNEIKLEIAAGYIVFDQFLGDNDAACTPTRP
ncbi:hypothetical protein [Persephonella sp.]